MIFPVGKGASHRLVIDPAGLPTEAGGERRRFHFPVPAGFASPVQFEIP